jgi:hypothetical protein
MSDGFSAFKAMALGMGALFVIATVAPGVTGGRFDPLRTKASKDDGGGKGVGKGKGGKGSTTTTDPAPTPTPTPTPTTTPTDTTGIYPEATLIPSNFDVDTTLLASWGSGAIAPENSTDVVGAFRFICGAGQLSYDDPIVYPGQPGRSHLHQYYGNTTASAYSTFASLRAAGDSTCNNMGNGTAANRSAYWMPAVFDGKGNVVQPDYIQVYYKREPLNSPACDPNSPTRAGICIGIPNGVRFIQGFHMAAGKDSASPGIITCSGKAWRTNAGLPVNNTVCPIGTKLELTVHSLSCWNGHLDSADHVSHFAPMIRNESTGWVNKCPSTHPYIPPKFTISAFYSIKEGDDVSLWSLSSDAMYPNLPKLSTLHFDYFEAWDAGVKDMWVNNCIGKKLNCSGGDLGNGKQLKGAAHPIYGWTNPDPRVPIPKGGMSGTM